MSSRFSRKDLLEMDVLKLRAYLHQFVHNRIENRVYEASVLRRDLPDDLEEKLQELLDVWQERNLPEDASDILFARELLKLAEHIRQGENLDLSPYWQKPFVKRDIEVVRRLIFGRRSIRFWTNDIVLNWTLDEVLKAGLWAPNACNLNPIRYIVVREENLPGLVNKDPKTPPAPVHIVLCHDMQAYQAYPGYKEESGDVQEWTVLDCGAAMENMILMAYGLGLGTVWITPTDAMRKKISKHFNLPRHIYIMTILDLGYPNLAPVPPGRISVEDAVIERV